MTPYFISLSVVDGCNSTIYIDPRDLVIVRRYPPKMDQRRIPIDGAGFKYRTEVFEIAPAETRVFVQRENGQIFDFIVRESPEEIGSKIQEFNTRTVDYAIERLKRRRKTEVKFPTS